MRAIYNAPGYGPTRCWGVFPGSLALEVYARLMTLHYTLFAPRGYFEFDGGTSKLAIENTFTNLRT